MAEPRVLVVEDEPSLAELYAEWLDDACAVETAADGREALAAAEPGVDAVLLDRRLPDRPGGELLAELRDRGIDPPTAMVTAVEPTPDAVAMAFDDYLVKPVSPEELRATVTDLLARGAVDDPLRESLAAAARGSSVVEAALSDADAGPPGVWRFDGGDSVVDMSEVTAHRLPAVVADLADEYESRLGYRDRFLLKWLHVVFPFFALSSVADAHAEAARAEKTLASMYVVLLDDVGERHGDRATLSAAADLPFPERADPASAGVAGGVDEAYLSVTESVWETFAERIASAPRYDAIAPVLRYDLRQTIEAIRYSALLNERPELANADEARAVGAHNMAVLVCADVDLAYSPGFDLDELGALRSLLLELQRMARIGNWLSTWERELEEGDVSAGVFVAAVESGLVDPDDLRGVADDAVAQRRVRTAVDDGGVEAALLEEWQGRYERLRADPPSIDSVDVEGLLDGMERVMAYHLARRGLK